MSLYIDYRVQTSNPASILIDISWHSQYPLLAVTSFDQDSGGSLTIYDELGEPLRDLDFPKNLNSRVTLLAWHPERRLLVAGWENGDFSIWNGGSEFALVRSPHRDSAVTLLEWSEQGWRLVSADTRGVLACWKLEAPDRLQVAFQHDLGSPLIHLAFKQRATQRPDVDLSGLAKAAVAGDEKALDMFSAWRPRTAGHRLTLQPRNNDSVTFYITSLLGVVYYVNETGECTEVLNTEGLGITNLLYYRPKEALVVATEGLTIAQYHSDASGSLSELSKVKVSVRSPETSVLWAGPGILAINMGDLTVRFYDLNTSDNYLLSPVESGMIGPNTSQAFTCLSYCKQREIFAGGTNSGDIFMWRLLRDRRLDGDSNGSPMEGPSDWEPLPPSGVRGTVKQLSWGPSSAQLAVNCISNVFILREQLLSAHYKQKVSAVQVAAPLLIVSSKNSAPPMDLNTDIQVKGVAVSKDHLVVWSARTVIVYQLLRDERFTASVEGTFSCVCECIGILNKTIVVLGYTESGGDFVSTVTLRTFQGTVKQTLNNKESEGKPLMIELEGDFLTVATDTGYIKMWDLSRREAKPHGRTKDVGEAVSDFGEIILARSNCNGTKVSFTIAQSNMLPEPKLYVWDVSKDVVEYFDFEKGVLSSEGEDMDLNSSGKDSNSESETTQAKSRSGLARRFVLSHRWDQQEPKLLVCEAKLHPYLNGGKPTMKRGRKGDRKGDGPLWERRVSSTTMTMPACVEDVSSAHAQGANLQSAEIIIVSFLAACEHQLLVQDALPLSDDHSNLLAVDTPYYVMLCRLNTQKSWKQRAPVDFVVMREFEGLEECDAMTKDAIINFSYHLIVGNMDEAFKVIRSIKSEAVWHSLARMCVKTQRLDVGAVCLGHMQRARDARALRMVASEPELEARVAALAIQLGLLDEAEHLYRSCGRLDLLNKMYQASDQWDKALAIAEHGDRIHLRTTYHNYAGVLEARGDPSGAAHMYQRADTHRHHVPRMLINDPPALQQYMLNSKDPALIKWWAQYLESTGEIEAALDHYEQAHDYVSTVRVLCFLKNYDKAAKTARETGHRAACYHLARQYEAMDDIQEAVNFFTMAKAYANAIRICKEHGLDEHLWTVSLQASPRDQLEAARYFETTDPPSSERAVLLYHRAGMLHKALDLAFRTQQFGALQMIAVDLTASSDPALIKKCAEFFVENKQYQNAVDLLATGRMYAQALDLCVEHNIPINENLAERLTVPKGEMDDAERIVLTEKLAECCYSQGNYHLATKKFTQAGLKVKAMQALLKSGDTEKILFFANVSRQKELYIMAANYLQTLDWQSQPELLRHIVTFYSKGKAPELLANFYTACAQVEVDEYQNYEKALGALAEASRCLAKVSSPKDPKQLQSAIEGVNQRTVLVKKFLDIKRMFERGDGEAATSQCRQLLNSIQDADIPVRHGDVYCLMVAHAVKQRDWPGASALVEEMKRYSGDNVAFYLPQELLEVLAGHGVTVPMKSSDPRIDYPIEEGTGEEEEEEIVEEEEVAENTAV